MSFLYIIDIACYCRLINRQTNEPNKGHKNAIWSNIVILFSREKQ